MKRDYKTPEFLLTAFSFEDILEDTTEAVKVSQLEDGGDDHNDSDTGEW